MINEFLFGTSQLGKRDYLFKISVCPGNLSVGRIKKTFTIYIPTGISVVCYTAVFSVVTQRSSPLTAAENRTTFLSLCVCGLTNKPIMYKKLDNT